MHSTQSLLEAHDLGIFRSKRWLVRHVDLQVARGQFVFIIGANGAGKTTTAKALLGLIEITEGRIEKAKELKIGYVPQRLQLNPTLPLTMRRLLQLSARYDRTELDHALEAVGLSRLGDPFVSTLSGGEFQRLMLARAMLTQPDLLLLDEPAQGVDTAGAEKLQLVVEHIRDELDCGVLCISHNLQLAMEKGDDFLVLIPHEYDDVPSTS